jgi:hypothetical protein
MSQSLTIMGTAPAMLVSFDAHGMLVDIPSPPVAQVSNLVSDLCKTKASTVK